MYQSGLNSCVALAQTMSESALFRSLDVALYIFGTLFVIKLFLSLTKTSLSLKKLTASANVVTYFKVEDVVSLQLHHHIPDQLLQKNIILVRQLGQPAQVLGIFNPTILVAQNSLTRYSTKELEAIVLHELWHLHASHTTWLCLARCMSSIGYIFPVLKDLERFLSLSFEVEADSFVISTQQTSRHLKQALAITLSQTPPTTFFPGMASEMSSRISALANHDVTFIFSLKRIGLTIVSLIIACSYALISMYQPQVQGYYHVPAKQNCNLQQCVQECLQSTFDDTNLQSRVEATQSKSTLQINPSRDI